MDEAHIEHANITVSDPKRTAELLCSLFGWEIRWFESAMNGEGTTYHVGSNNSYIALYAGKTVAAPTDNKYETLGGLNHIGIVVSDIKSAEKRVIDAGYSPHTHADYEPGIRFYFKDHDDVEFEVISYQG